MNIKSAYAVYNHMYSHQNSEKSLLWCINKGQKMIDSQQINSMADKISSLLPPGFDKIKDDIEEKVKAVLMQQLSKLELVTREEFDIQTKVLARTRAKLDALEKRIEELAK